MQLLQFNDALISCSRCSVDPYLFDNFETVDGDFLAAKFKAFKFPESNYVQFKGTVSVCIDKCKGVSTFILPINENYFQIAQKIKKNVLIKFLLVSSFSSNFN